MADLLAEFAPRADDFGVHLAIEPLHSMFCADRAVHQVCDRPLPLPADTDGRAPSDRTIT
ncbi:hypothetical protein [Streptomyces sp. NPDC002463]|uniref:hypothetical protein n=1 Tax=Streptomyces sp. NPDC002463 TaxID=3364645 RepID=UPI0036ADCC46